MLILSILNGTPLDLKIRLCQFMEVDTAGNLILYYFKKIRQVIVFRGLIWTEINVYYSTHYIRLERWSQEEVSPINKVSSALSLYGC